MLIVGMFFFSVAVVSGLLGFADIVAMPPPAGDVVFYSSLLLASLTFTLFLQRTNASHRSRNSETLGEPKTVDRSESSRPEGEAESALSGACHESLVIVGAPIAGAALVRGGTW